MVRTNHSEIIVERSVVKVQLYMDTYLKPLYKVHLSLKYHPMQCHLGNSFPLNLTSQSEIQFNVKGVMYITITSSLV